jgi:hypothetical protein
MDQVAVRAVDLYEVNPARSARFAAATKVSTTFAMPPVSGAGTFQP